MKLLKNVLILMLGSSLGASIALGAGAKLIFAEQISNHEVSLTLRSQYHCNAPITTLEYLYSGRSAMGPHFYEVEVVPQNRMNCGKPEEFRVILPIPENLRERDELTLVGDNGSHFSISIE